MTQRPIASRIDALGRARECAQRRAAEGDDYPRLYGGDLAREPHVAGADVSDVRSPVKTPLTARFPSKMLHGVRDEEVAALEAGRCEAVIENLAGRADKCVPAQILLIAGLLANQHDARVRRPDADDRLRRVSPQIATTACSRPVLGARQLLERPFNRLGRAKLAIVHL